MSLWDQELLCLAQCKTSTPFDQVVCTERWSTPYCFHLRWRYLINRFVCVYGCNKPRNPSFEALNTSISRSFLWAIRTDLFVWVLWGWHLTRCVLGFKQFEPSTQEFWSDTAIQPDDRSVCRVSVLTLTTDWLKKKAKSHTRCDLQDETSVVSIRKIGVISEALSVYSPSRWLEQEFNFPLVEASPP